MDEASTLDVTVVTGMSGAGRSAAADVLEDLGFFVIDNLPPALIPKVAELGRGREGTSRFALVVDTRDAPLASAVRDLGLAPVVADVVMTEAATRFVTPLTFQALTGRAVGTDLWHSTASNAMDHIEISRGADLIVVAPASAERYRPRLLAA